jgi:hypothetical protein
MLSETDAGKECGEVVRDEFFESNHPALIWQDHKSI